MLLFLAHYLSASVTAHVTAMLPVVLAAGSTVPGINMPQFALLWCLTLGLMGIVRPYGTGPSQVYYGSGYLPSVDCWGLGAVFGLIFRLVFLLVGVPWVMFIGSRASTSKRRRQSGGRDRVRLAYRDIAADFACGPRVCFNQP